MNYPGCTLGKHSNVKPEEPKTEQKQSLPDEVVVVKPAVAPQMIRPSYDTPLTNLIPILTSSVKQMVGSDVNNTDNASNVNEGVAIGTPCKNSGCKVAYESEETDLTTCVYHPGCPIFHEGLKYWSCCQKKTTDFQTFLNQEGCAQGSHLWHKQVHLINSLFSLFIFLIIKVFNLCIIFGWVYLEPWWFNCLSLMFIQSILIISFLSFD